MYDNNDFNEKSDSTENDSFSKDAKYPTDEMLLGMIQDVLDKGYPTNLEELQVNVDFQVYPPKKKNRTLGEGKLVFPKGAYVGMFNEVKQFYSKSSIISFLEEADHQDVFSVVNSVKEKFPGEAIGVAGGAFYHKEEDPLKNSGGWDVINIFWTDEKTRVYYDPIQKREAICMPKVIVV